MMDMAGQPRVGDRRRGASGALRLMLLACAICHAAAAAAEPPAPPADPAAPIARAAPDPRGNAPGFLDALNRWIDQSSDRFKSSLQDSKSKIDSFNAQTANAAKSAAQATKEATDAFIKWPSAKTIEGREHCEPTATGSPDCRKAAEVICRAKGFATGKSVDTRSTRKCPATVWLSGRPPADDECPTETYVIRAVCQ